MTRADPRKERTRGRPATIERWVKWRIVAAGALLALLLLAVAWRAYGIQVRDTDTYREMADDQHRTVIRVPAPRGGIYDRGGVELAVTADIDSVYAVPREVERPVETARALAEFLEIDEDVVAERLDRDRAFAWVARHVTAEAAEEVRARDLQGIALRAEPRRFYPARETTGPVLGFTNIDGDGLDGVELTMEDLLRGVGGEVDAVRDARGRLAIADLPVTADPGAELTLTIDRYVQHAAHRAVADAVEAQEARAGTAVVIDVETGGVLAMANAPSYDPNDPGPGLAENARNRAITDAHEPGSLLKVFLVAAALHEGAAGPDTTFDTGGGRMQVGQHTIRDTFRDDEVDVGGIIRRSSNVAAVKLADRLGEEAYERALRRFGFAETTEIELPGERAGTLRPHEAWREIEFATLAYGYGMSATPLQITAAVAAVGNGGIYHPPRIVDRVVSPEGETRFQRSPSGRRVIDREAADELLPMLASVFRGGPDGGTARRLRIDGYRAGGKTGTALKVDLEEGGYHDDRYVSSFTGLAPADDPKIAITVVIDEPNEGYYGAEVAGPPFAAIAGQTLRYLGVPPAEDADLRERTAGARQRPRAPPVPEPSPPLEVEWDPEGAGAGADEEDGLALTAARERMPDLRGLGLARALSRAGEVCVDVDVAGSGVARRQEPAPGTPILGPTRCRLELAPRGPGR